MAVVETKNSAPNTIDWFRTDLVPYVLPDGVTTYLPVLPEISIRDLGLTSLVGYSVLLGVGGSPIYLVGLPFGLYEAYRTGTFYRVASLSSALVWV